MIYSIYLHNNIIETLSCYGDLSDVVNNILDAAEQGSFDIVDLPPAPSRDGATRCEINITSEYYLTLASTFPMNSPRISLRRILYWFVEQEMYDALEWEAVNEYKSKEKTKILKKLQAVKLNFEKVTTLLNYEEKAYAKAILDHIINLEEIVKDGR